MEADTQAHVAFFLTGRRPGEFLDAVDGLDLRPALFAGYRDLTPLRYDFPLVLESKGADPAAVASLSGLFDKALEKVAAGADGERIRKHGLRLEQEIRALLARRRRPARSRSSGSSAATRIAAQGDASFDDSRRRLRAAIKSDGELADCDAALPRRLLRHVWEASQAGKAAQFRANLDRLILKLSGILQSDFEQSAQGPRRRSPEGVRGRRVRRAPSISKRCRACWSSRSPGNPCRRAASAASPSCFGCSSRSASSPAALKPMRRPSPTPSLFDSCAAALKAYRERQPRQVELARALVVAELEIDGRVQPRAARRGIRRLRRRPGSIPRKWLPSPTTWSASTMPGWTRRRTHA